MNRQRILWVIFWTFRIGVSSLKLFKTRRHLPAAGVDDGIMEFVVTGAWIMVGVADPEGLTELSAVEEAWSDLIDDETVAEGVENRMLVEDGDWDALSLSCRRSAW
jgi:hypothetical protein